ncbi:MAG: aromatic amino acid transport family protein [Patescibacteria group bacterium]
MKQKTYTLVVALNLLGTIVGAGVFGLPEVFARTGILGGSLLFFAVLVLAILLHLLFTDVVLNVPGKHRIPGYVGVVLGRKMYWIAGLSVFLKISGTILAYIILGGEFLSMLSRNVFGEQIWIWSLIFWIIGALIVFFGLKVVAVVESELTWLLIGFMLFSLLVLFPFVNWNLFGQMHANGLFNAFGVIFFSVMGISIMPDLVDLAHRKQSDSRKGIFLGTLLAGILSWLFGIFIAGVYPNIHSVRDIQLVFPPIFWWLIPAIGLLAVITSYITMAQALKLTLHIDLKLGSIAAWIITILFPFLLYVFVSRDLLTTLGFVGGVLTAFVALLLCICAYKVFNSSKTKYKFNPVWRQVPLVLSLALILLLFVHFYTHYL